MQSVADAEGKRLVINNSWGLPQWGTPDGTSLSNQFIDAMSDEGVVFVSSNGNNGDVDFHIDHTFEEPGDTIRSRVKFYPLNLNPNAWGQNLTLWGEEGESFEMGFQLIAGLSTVVGESPMYNTSDGPMILDTIEVVNNDTVIYDVVMEQSHPSNGRPFIQMRIHKGDAYLSVLMQVTSEAGRVHAWNHTHLTNDVGNWGQDFQAAQSGWLSGDPYYGIQQPACSHSVIAVGAYSSEYLNQAPSELKNLNILSASILECKEDYSFWIAIHCNNINDIAGFQFELPNNLEILDVAGVRSDIYDFQLHHNDNGLILGFSMSGDTIPPLSYGSNLDQSIVLKLHVQADPASIFSFPIKSILAGSKGEKLSFQNLEHTLTFKNNSMVISFIE